MLRYPAPCATGPPSSGPPARPERRLAAILAADVVGYSRLMERDEAGTLERLKAHRKELVEPLVAEHRGRIVKLMGDGALCEFACVVDAVACAVAIQRGMAEREADVPEAERIRFRIGVNLGDVIVEGEDIYGDGVNVAARLEQLAEPGGIVVSGTVFDHLRGELGCTFASLGEQHLKNIERPVRAYRMVLGGGDGGPPERPALPLPDKPSLAVLPFENLSGDPEQGYFADGDRRGHHHRPGEGRRACSSSPATRASPTGARPSTSGRSGASWACATCSRAASARPASGCASPAS